ncbi:hypothetical protein D043_0026A, partial [Vibrio parahaemolyticus EKP-021]|jgi:hypothetical protein
MSPAS